MILTNFYNRTPQVTSKIIIQLLVILSIADLIWIIYFSSAWIQLSEEEKKELGDESGIVTFWDSLWFIHGFVYFLAYIELILKGLLLYYLITDYKGKYELKTLINLSYDDNQNNNNISNDIAVFGRDIGTNSMDDNFQ